MQFREQLSDRQAAEVLVLDPPSGTPSVAEIRVDVAGVEGGSKCAVNLGTDLAVLIELADLAQRCGSAPEPTDPPMAAALRMRHAEAAALSVAWARLRSRYI